jgi:hypothetical protein
VQLSVLPADDFDADIDTVPDPDAHHDFQYPCLQLMPKKRPIQTMTVETAEGNEVCLWDWYRGKAVFLLVNGPSLTSFDLDRLRGPGIITMGLNNGWSVFRPDLWMCVDTAGQFLDTCWKDPHITKFVPMGKKKERLRAMNPSTGRPEDVNVTVASCPAVWYFHRNDRFDPLTYLDEGTVNWGNNGKFTDSLGCKGSRSVMLSAMKMIYYLGFRQVFILGADFNMQPGRDNYAFKQDRSSSSIKGNNATFVALNKRFHAILPQLHAEGRQVYNCLESSGLTPFPYISFDTAVQMAEAECNIDVVTEGWYDENRKRKQDKRKQGMPDLDQQERLRRREKRRARARAVKAQENAAGPRRRKR